MINANGERFVDEGADFRNYTYAKYGRVILMQPGQFAWQVFDKKILHLLRDEYRIKQVTKVRADTLEELVKKLDDVDPARALETIKTYNKAVHKDVPSIRTSKTDADRRPAHSKIELGEHHRRAAIRGFCRDLRNHLHVRRTENRYSLPRDRHGWQAIPGLHAAGELVGGLFYFNYPGGTGLMAGAVFGRIAGTTAGQRAAQVPQ